MPTRPISIRRRLGSVLGRSISNIDTWSSPSRYNDGEPSSASSATSTSTTPAMTDGESSPDCTPEMSRSASPRPDTSPLELQPLERSVTGQSLASSLLSRLSLSGSRSDPFEAYLADKRKRELKEHKAVKKRIKDFHAVVTGAVFSGSVVHYDYKTEVIDGVEAQASTSRAESTYRVGVTKIEPKDAGTSSSAKAVHLDSFAKYYNDHCNGEPLECFFDVFMKSVPRPGAQISFIVRPNVVGDDVEYVAVACNVLDKYGPVHV